MTGKYPSDGQNELTGAQITPNRLVCVWSEWEKKRAEEAKKRQLASQNNDKGRAVSANLNEQQKPDPIRADRRRSEHLLLCSLYKLVKNSLGT